MPQPPVQRPAQRFAHLSDPHLTSLADVSLAQLFSKRLLGYLSWRRRRRAEHRREVLDVLTRDLQAQAPAQIVLTGDLTHIGLESEFRAAAHWLAELAAPAQLALVPGNHDATVAASAGFMWRYWADYLAGDPLIANAVAGGVPADTNPMGNALKRNGPMGDPLRGEGQVDKGVAGGRLSGAPATDAVAQQAASCTFPTLRVRGDIAFIGLSSAVATPPLLASGRIDADQLARLPALLNTCAQRGLFRVVYLHHCPLPGVDRWRKALRNARNLCRILEASGVELLLHGHGHRRQEHTLHTRAGDAPVLAVPSASARGRHRDAAAYSVFTVEKSGAGWQLHCERRTLADDAASMQSAALTTYSLARAHATGEPPVR